MSSVHVQHYLSRARDFLEGMRLLQEDLDEYKFSSAWLGIHCAISYSDALRTGLGCENRSADDHLHAARDLKKRLANRKIEHLEGIRKLEELIRFRSLIAYDTETVSSEKVERIVKLADRFASWAESLARRFHAEGW